MKLIATGIAVAFCTAGLLAQSSEVHSKTKLEVKDGKKVTVSGCVQQTGDGLVLSDVEGNVAHSYLLVGKSDDLAKHVGHRVEITGKAADEDHGKIKTETKDKVDGGKEHKTTSKAEGDLSMPLLGVDHVKMLAKSCS